MATAFADGNSESKRQKISFPWKGRLPRKDRRPPGSGQSANLGLPNKPQNSRGRGFAPDGTLDGVSADSSTPDAGSRCKFNPATGAATTVGVKGDCFDVKDLAWHPDSTMDGAVNDSLYWVDAATGQATHPILPSPARAPSRIGWVRPTHVVLYSPGCDHNHRREQIGYENIFGDGKNRDGPAGERVRGNWWRGSKQRR